MAKNVVTTEFARANFAKAQAGDEAIKTVSQISFGDGGVDLNGDPITPSTTDTALGNKLLAKSVATKSYPTTTTVRYTVSLDFSELVGYDISELGLEDALGNLLARKTFKAQPKDEENTFTFEWDEEF